MTTTTPAGQPVDLEKAIDGIRRHRQQSDPLSLYAVRLGEKYAKKLVVDFPDRADWPMVAHAILVSTSMNATLVATPEAVRFLGATSSNYVRTMLNVAALGAVELLDRLDAERAEEQLR